MTETDVMIRMIVNETEKGEKKNAAIMMKEIKIIAAYEGTKVEKIVEEVCKNTFKNIHLSI